MPYTPTVWENDPSTATPLNATNLNKLTDELRAQAEEVVIPHSLPTWVDDDEPALTDAAPFNAMEEIAESVAIAVGLGYVATVWEPGWIPGRSAYYLNKLEQQAQANRARLDSPSLPFAEPTLVNPIQPSLSALAGSSFNCQSGADYLIDLDWQPRSNTLILTGSPRRVSIINSYFRITSSTSLSPYSRGGLGLQLTAEHVSIRDYFAQGDHAGCTLTDAFRVAAASTTKVTLQRARLEGKANTSEPAEHCDAYQVQGPVGALEIGLVTAQAPGVQPPNHGGKCFQIAHEPWPGATYGVPFTARFKQVNMVGLGTGGARSGTMFIRGPQAHHNTGVFVGNITETLEDVWATVDGTNVTDFPGWFYVWTTTLSTNPNGVVSGSAPNRTITYDAATQLISNGAGAGGFIREGRPGGADYVPRSLLETRGLSVVA